MITDDTINDSWKDGYDDGVLFHMNLDLNARDDDRYADDPDYRAGFDQAGEDS